MCQLQSTAPGISVVGSNSSINRLLTAIVYWVLLAIGYISYAGSMGAIGFMSYVGLPR